MSLRINKETIFFASIMLMLIFLDSQYMPGANVPVLFLVTNILYGKRFSLLKGRMIKLFLCFVFYLLAITLINITSNYDLSNSIMYFIEIAIIFISCSAALYGIDVRKFMQLMRNVGIFLGVLGIIEGIIQYPFFTVALKLTGATAYDPNGYRVVSIFAHPIVSGVLFMFCWGALLIMPFKKFSVNFIAHAILMTVIVLTRSRSVWLSFAAIVGIFFIKKLSQSEHKISKKYIQRFALLVLLVLLVDAATGFHASGNIYEFFRSRIVGSLYAGEGAGNIIRIDIVLNSINYWKDGNLDKFLFGMGKNYDKYFMQLFPVIKYSTVWTAAIDNQYFTTIHEAGIIGFILIIAILICALKRIVKANKNEKVKLIVNSSIVSVYVSNYFYEGLNYMSVLTILVVLMAISDMCERKNDENMYCST